MKKQEGFLSSLETGVPQEAREERAIGFPGIRISPVLTVDGAGSEEEGLELGATGLKEEGRGLYS